MSTTGQIDVNDVVIDPRHAGEQDNTVGMSGKGKLWMRTALNI